MSALGPRLCENSDVELTRRRFVSITLNNKRIAVAVTVERRKERKQFCVFSARARFHTARVNRVRLTVYLFWAYTPPPGRVFVLTKHIFVIIFEYPPEVIKVHWAWIGPGR